THHPLIQIMLQVHPTTPTTPPHGPLAGVPVQVSGMTAKVDLTFALTERRDAEGVPDGLDGVLEYATDLYGPATAGLLAGRLARLLAAVADDPERPIEDLPVDGPAGADRAGADRPSAGASAAGARLPAEPGELSADAWALLRSGDGHGLPPIRLGDPRTGGRPQEPLAPRILDASGRPAPNGVPGELHLAATARSSADAAAPLPTGWRAMWTADGELRLLGPLDPPRLRGYRVDAARVAARLAEHPAVLRAAVVLRADATDTANAADAVNTAGVRGEPQLIGYVVAEPGTAALPEAEVLAMAARSLPDYLLPTRLVAVDRLPYAADGSLDERALPAPGTTTGRGGAPTPAPALQAPLIELFSEVLGGKPIGPEDNFFRSGGHSLLAVRLVNRVRAAFGAELTLRDVFQHPSAAALAAVLDVPAAPGAPSAATRDIAAPGTADTPAPAPAPVPARPTLRRRTRGGARTAAL
ncbi:phosphopantetheine-binding protein, partial [Streptomyces sp. O3]